MQPFRGSNRTHANVRIDSAMRENLEITGDYDPMLAKVIAWGEDRASALNTLDAALGRYTLLGVDTNVEYLRLLINDPEVPAGHLDTGLIERKLPSMTFRHVGPAELIAAALTLWLDRTGSAHRRPRVEDRRLLACRRTRRVDGHPWCSWRGNRHGVTYRGERHRQGKRRRRELRSTSGWRIAVTTGSWWSSTTARSPSRLARRRVATASRLYLGNDGWSCGLEVLNRAERLRRMLAGIQRDEGAADPEVRSPMPGTVVSVSVADGDTVEEGQALLAVEAMKMEHQLVASVAGTVHLTSKPGDLVKADQVLATIHVDTDNTNTRQHAAQTAPAQTRKSSHEHV